MKTHILFLSLTALLLVGCASNASRSVSSTQQTYEPHEYSQHEGNAGREFARQ